MDARTLRQRRKERIAARRAIQAGGDEGDTPDWIEEKIEEDTGEDIGDPGLIDEEDGEGCVRSEGEPADLPPSDDVGDEMDEEILEDEPVEEMEEEEPLDEMESDFDPMLIETPDPMEASAAFNYRPIYQKPTHLGSDAPRGGYHYFGPPPDAGTSYGYYADADTGLGLIAPLKTRDDGKLQALKIFSPVSGKAMNCTGKVEIDGVATILALADQMMSLPGGRVTSAPITSISTGRVYDPMSGKDITESLAKLRTQADGEELEEEVIEDEPMDEVPVDETPLDEVPMEEPPAEEPMEGQEEEEEVLVDEPVEEVLPEEGEELVEEEEPMDEEDAEGVQYEALQDIEGLGEDISESDVHMTLFNEDAQNPYWNVDLGGQPVARVYLMDQEKPEEIKQVFCSVDYYKGVSGAIAKVGAGPVFKQIKAKLWANEISKTKLAKDISAKAEASAQGRYNAVIANVMKNLLDRVSTVCAGMDKNFYRDVGNPLKEALWGELHRFGIANPSPMIEAAFRRGATPYFEAVLSKSVEYMELAPEALKQIKAAIGEADILPPEGDVGDQLPEAIPVDAPQNAATLSDRLVASSVAIGGVPALTGNAFGDHKAALRNELSLGGAGPLRGRTR